VKKGGGTAAAGGSARKKARRASFLKDGEKKEAAATSRRRRRRTAVHRRHRHKNKGKSSLRDGDPARDNGDEFTCSPGERRATAATTFLPSAGRTNPGLAESRSHSLGCTSGGRDYLPACAWPPRCCPHPRTTLSNATRSGLLAPRNPGFLLRSVLSVPRRHFNCRLFILFTNYEWPAARPFFQATEPGSVAAEGPPLVRARRKLFAISCRGASHIHVANWSRTYLAHSLFNAMVGGN
jgi:hypothetical protein